MFDRPCDLIVLPCSTGGTITEFVGKQVRTYCLPVPRPGMELGTLAIRRTQNYISPYVAYAASVKGNTSTARAIEEIGRQIGQATRNYDDIHSISAPLLGTGAGGVNREVVVRCLQKGFLAASAPGSVLTIHILHKPTYETIRKKLLDKREQPGPSKPAADKPGGAGFDSFISYRREGGSETARLLKSELEKHNHHAFLDVDDLGASYFDERLLVQIEHAAGFIVILSPGCLERCNNEGDWLRREISHALTLNKNVVPVLLGGFAFPADEELPVDIRDVKRHNAVVFSHEYFQAFTSKLLVFLNSPRTGA